MYTMWHNKFERILKLQYSGLPLLLNHILVIRPGATKSDVKDITEISLSKIWILVVES